MQANFDAFSRFPTSNGIAVQGETQEIPGTANHSTGLVLP
jgi:hypothetical protein